ncbi:MAG: flavodoxin family protein [Thermoguttaceae bacterium]
MHASVTRRKFVEAMGIGAGAAAGLAALEAHAAPPGKKTLKIVGVCCSPRKGKTTAQALGICLEAAKGVAPDRIETELIELADLEIPGYVAAGVPLKPGQKDDFPAIAAKLADRRVAGIIIGTPVYFGSMSGLCKAFLDRCILLRMKQFALANKVGGVVAVGGVRNGGQEMTIQGVQAALLCQEMVLVGDGRPTGHWGATVWNNGKDDISQDEFGVATLKNLGRRVAEVALSRSAAT